MHLLHRISHFLERSIRLVVILAFLLLVLAVLLQVGTRFLPVRITGLSEIARYSQIWFVFFAVAVLARHGELIGANFILNMLSGTLQLVVWVLVRVLLLAFLVSLAWVAYGFVDFLASTGRRSPELRVPMYYAFAPVFLGTALTIFMLLVEMIQHIHTVVKGSKVVGGLKPEVAKAEIDGDAT